MGFAALERSSPRRARGASPRMRAATSCSSFAFSRPGTRRHAGCACARALRRRPPTSARLGARHVAMISSVAGFSTGMVSPLARGAALVLDPHPDLAHGDVHPPVPGLSRRGLARPRLGPATALAGRRSACRCAGSCRSLCSDSARRASQGGPVPWTRSSISVEKCVEARGQRPLADRCRAGGSRSRPGSSPTAASPSPAGRTCCSRPGAGPS